MQVVCVVMSKWKNEAKGDKYEERLNFHCVCEEFSKAVEVIDDLILFGTRKILKMNDYSLKKFDDSSPENNRNGCRDILYISQRTEYGASPETTYVTTYFVQFAKVM